MNDHTEQSFFTYQQAVVNFVFSFSWNVVEKTFDSLAGNLTALGQGWQCLQLYRRPLSWMNDKVQAAYHPTIVSENVRVLHYHGDIKGSVEILSPFVKSNEIDFKKTTASIGYDIRLFENGTGTCTFVLDLTPSEQINFESILLIQHLATSIKHNPGSREAFSTDLKHHTHSFIKVSPEIETQFQIADEIIYLSQLYAEVLSSIPGLVGVIHDEWRVLDRMDSAPSTKRDRQNPYVISVLRVADAEMIEKFETQSESTLKEIGAIAVRLTQDNGNEAAGYYKDLRREYIFKSLGFFISIDPKTSKQSVRLRNYSHSKKLFYTYGRRAAVAITSDFDSHPSYFAIPTFVNILEILRCRWHLGTITNLKLDDTLEKISHTDDINNLIDKIFECRVLYGLFLQNPAPYLFDSGAVTEISDSAENIFWLSKIGNELEKKLAAIDKLIEVKYTKQSMSKYL